MNELAWFSPYDEGRRIGSVILIGATEANINLTQAGTGEPSWLFGQRIGAGEVNEFVFVEAGATAILGRVVKTWLAGAERLSVDSLTRKPQENHPVGTVQLLTSIDAATGENFRGIFQYPRLGAQVYAAHPQLVATLAEGKHSNATQGLLSLPLATLPNDSSVTIHASPERLFSRHCAILGTTGGGKSYTLARLIEQVIEAGGKAILLDASGEFAELHGADHRHVGEHPNATKATKVTFPHWQFTDSDIRALLRPSALSQAPKLEESIRSLKLVEIITASPVANLVVKNDALEKLEQLKTPFEDAIQKYAVQLQDGKWKFSSLAKQIVNECIHPDKDFGKDKTRWGGTAQNDVGHCLNLIARIEAYSRNPHLKWMLDADQGNTIPDVILKFVKNGKGLLRFDLSQVPFEANSREVLVNAIGRYLLKIARDKEISHEKPLLVFIDEAHQFLNRRVGDDSNNVHLDAFGNIAKEGRKYGLNVVIATQRPRDIPEDVLSQIGTLIVHRLTNQHDQEIVKKAVGDMDQRSASFLPTLGQGEALLLGVDFPFPLTVKINLPNAKPTSKSATFSTAWKAVKEAPTESPNEKTS
jgi:hypothetical protein